MPTILLGGDVLDGLERPMRHRTNGFAARLAVSESPEAAEHHIAGIAARARTAVTRPPRAAGAGDGADLRRCRRRLGADHCQRPPGAAAALPPRLPAGGRRAAWRPRRTAGFRSAACARLTHQRIRCQLVRCRPEVSVLSAGSRPEGGR